MSKKQRLEKVAKLLEQLWRCADADDFTPEQWEQLAQIRVRILKKQRVPKRKK